MWIVPVRSPVKVHPLLPATWRIVRRDLTKSKPRECSSCEDSFEPTRRSRLVCKRSFFKDLQSVFKVSSILQDRSVQSLRKLEASRKFLEKLGAKVSTTRCIVHFAATRGSQRIGRSPMWSEIRCFIEIDLFLAFCYCQSRMFPCVINLVPLVRLLHSTVLLTWTRRPSQTGFSFVKLKPFQKNEESQDRKRSWTWNKRKVNSHKLLCLTCWTKDCALDHVQIRFMQKMIIRCERKDPEEVLAWFKNRLTQK